MQIEVIVTNKDEAIIAQEYGVNRLELIHAFSYGGLSPKISVTKDVCSAVSIPVNIMLRPNNSFVYSSVQVRDILAELRYIRENTNANGIVFGALDQDSNLDTKLLELIIKEKGHLQLTFHRAIDVSKNIITTYQQLLSYPEVNLVLTSGGKATAGQGITTIKKMVEINNGQKNAQIMPGSGITLTNVQQIIQQSQVSHTHVGTGIRAMPDNVLSKQKLQQLVFSISDMTSKARSN